MCLNCPGRPQIEGPTPDGTSLFSSAMLIAPEARVEMVTKGDGSRCLRRIDPQRMGTGVMTGYPFDPSADDIKINGENYVRLDCPGRPQIDGPLPDGVMKNSYRNF